MFPLQKRRSRNKKIKACCNSKTLASPNRNLREFSFPFGLASSLSPAGDNIARFLALRHGDWGYVRGSAPKTPAGNFTVLNRRASPCRAHRSFRTAPPGRCFGHWPRSPPVPPGFSSKPCNAVSSSALCANIARLLRACGRRGSGYVRGSAPKTPAGT